MKRRFTPHLVWGLLALIAVPSLWFAWSILGGVLMLLCIAVSFVLWQRIGSRGSWIALIIVGIGMASLTGWQAITGERCPAPGTKVFLKENKPPIGCIDVRAGAGAMAIFFGLVALIGCAAPIYSQMLPDSQDETVE